MDDYGDPAYVANWASSARLPATARNRQDALFALNPSPTERAMTENDKYRFYVSTLIQAGKRVFLSLWENLASHGATRQLSAYKAVVSQIRDWNKAKAAACFASAERLFASLHDSCRMSLNEYLVMIEYRHSEFLLQSVSVSEIFHFFLTAMADDPLVYGGEIFRQAVDAPYFDKIALNAFNEIVHIYSLSENASKELLDVGPEDSLSNVGGPSAPMMPMLMMLPQAAGSRYVADAEQARGRERVQNWSIPVVERVGMQQSRAAAAAPPGSRPVRPGAPNRTGGGYPAGAAVAQGHRRAGDDRQSVGAQSRVSAFERDLDNFVSRELQQRTQVAAAAAPPPPPPADDVRSKLSAPRAPIERRNDVIAAALSAAAQHGGDELEVHDGDNVLPELARALTIAPKLVVAEPLPQPMPDDKGVANDDVHQQQQQQRQHLSNFLAAHAPAVVSPVPASHDAAAHVSAPDAAAAAALLAKAVATAEQQPVPEFLKDSDARSVSSRHSRASKRSGLAIVRADAHNAIHLVADDDDVLPARLSQRYLDPAADADVAAVDAAPHADSISRCNSHHPNNDAGSMCL